MVLSNHWLGHCTNPTSSKTSKKQRHKSKYFNLIVSRFSGLCAGYLYTVKIKFYTIKTKNFVVFSGFGKTVKFWVIQHRTHFFINLFTGPSRYIIFYSVVFPTIQCCVVLFTKYFNIFLFAFVRPFRVGMGSNVCPLPALYNCHTSLLSSSERESVTRFFTSFLFG